MTASVPESVMDLLATYFVGGASNAALSDAALREEAERLVGSRD